MKQIFIDKQYDLNRIPRCAELMAFAKAQEAKGRRPLVVDAGANIGLSALYFMGNLPTAHIVAIEPDRENFDLLSKNVQGLDVELIRGAAASTRGKAKVTDPGRGQWAYRTEFILEETETSDAVPRVTINELYASLHSKYFPFIAKIDIEGAERDLFAAATEWVSATPIIIVELHDWMFPKERASQPFLQCVSKLDRDFIGVDADVYSIANDLESLAAWAA